MLSLSILVLEVHAMLVVKLVTIMVFYISKSDNKIVLPTLNKILLRRI